METFVINNTVEAVRSLGVKFLSNSVEEIASSFHVKSSNEYRLLQPVWEWRHGYERVLEHPLWPILMSIVVYFSCMVPWMIIDFYGKDWKWIQRYKIQPEKEVTWPDVKKAMALTGWNHVLYLFPVSVAQWVWTPSTPLPAEAPIFAEFCYQQFLALMIFDFEYFVWHSVHHKVRWLYRNVHSVHHEYYAPSVWVTQYLHPWELISVGIFTTTSPWFFDSHPMTQWSFMLLSIYVSVEAHIGYDLPFMPHNWAPLWGGGIKHDMHHQKPRTNFQPFFCTWDRLLGSYCPGQLAGGYKPPKLMDWEKQQKDAVRKRIAAKYGKQEEADRKHVEAKLRAMEAD